MRKAYTFGPARPCACGGTLHHQVICSTRNQWLADRHDPVGIVLPPEERVLETWRCDACGARESQVARQHDLAAHVPFFLGALLGTIGALALVTCLILLRS